MCLARVDILAAEGTDLRRVALGNLALSLVEHGACAGLMGELRHGGTRIGSLSRSVCSNRIAMMSDGR